MATMKLFNAIHAAVTATIEFDPKWNNGTGYMDGAVTADLGLNPGDIVKGNTGGVNNRNFLIMGTPTGNVIVFQRYTAGAQNVVVANCPPAVGELLGLNNAIRQDALAKAFGQSADYVCEDDFKVSDFCLKRQNSGVLLGELFSNVHA